MESVFCELMRLIIKGTGMIISLSGLALSLSFFADLGESVAPIFFARGETGALKKLP